MTSSSPTNDHISSESGEEEDQISSTESQENSHDHVYFVSRPVYNKSNFFGRYSHEPNRDKSFGEKFRSLKPEISSEKIINVLLSFVPVVSWLPKYKLRENLGMDIASGLTIGVMNIPQGQFYLSILLTSLLLACYY